MKIIVDKIATEYQDSGQGPVILFLHGWQDSLHSFDPLTSALVVQYRVISLDLPGFGQSELPKAAWSVDNYIDFVVNFAEKLNVNPDYLVGHSFGGRIIIKGVAEGKLKPKKIILIGAAGIRKKHSLNRSVFKAGAKIGKVVLSVPPLNLLKQWAKEKLYAQNGSDYIKAGPLKDTFLNVINEDLSGYVGKINTPALLIWGSLDEETPLSDGKFIKGALKNSQLVVLEKTTHFVHREEPETVVRLIKEFAHE